MGTAISSPLVVSFGGGTDSTAMLIEMHRRGIRPDLILFADTGKDNAEKPPTYTHVQLMDGWCRERWGIGITVVRNDGMYGSLEKNCIEKQMLPSIAYGFKSCSDKYKRRPQEKYCRQWPTAITCWELGGKLTKAIGYNADEWHRQHNITEDAEYQYRYFLIEWGITKRMCREICLSAIGYVPCKSACFFCPSSKKAEVIRLAAEYPDLFNRAVAMERNVDYHSKETEMECPECGGSGCGVCGQRGFFVIDGNTTVGLGRNWSWEELVKADANQFKLFPEAPEISCMCFDGEAA